MAKPAEVTDDNFEAEVLQSVEPVVVDFWAEWCGPCKQISPLIQDLAERYEGRVKVMKMNVDDSHATSGKYGIRAIPTLLAFQNGQVVEQIQGASPKAIQEMVEKLA